MGMKRYKPAEFLDALRQPESRTPSRSSDPEAIRHLEVREGEFSRWCAEYAATTGDRLRRLHGA